MPVLRRAFYSRSTEEVARELLGHLLVHSAGGRVRVARIVETEAYLGEDDPASHAARGRTPRNAVMYGPPGHAYVYFTYGMHHCLNAVTEPEGRAAAVLIRAAEPQEGLEWMRAARGGVERDTLIASGPARLCQALGLDRAHSGLDLTLAGGELRIERGARRRSEVVGASGRVGIRVAVERQWRFFLEGNPHVSKGPRVPRSRRL
jgi:DNA-3-methyladenine glycosylase